jgi:IMP dehydrogenase
MGLTFDDVLLIPQYSEILPGDASVKSRFSRHISLNTPVVSAAMDTVTEDRMAIAMALEGGIGVIHRNQAPERQAEEVAAVKAAAVPGDAALANVDSRGRLRVAAAVGVGADSVARAEALVRAGVDALVVDTAHGHTRNVIEALRRYRASYGDSIDLVAGNVATPEGTAALIEAGADGVKVGIGPGSICTTRIVAGVGVPQLTAIMMCAAAAHAHDVPIIGDGGIRYSGDIVKALAAGADSVMLGRLLAVAEESPGEAERVGGRVVKEYRAMGSLGAMQAGSDRYPQIDRHKLVPEGVEAIVAVAGPLSGIIYQLIGGTKAGMTYCGADSIADLRVKARFVQLTHSGQIESHPHDIDLARSAPNYP